MKSNKKRILLVLAILTMAIVLSFVFVACNKTDGKVPGDKDLIEPPKKELSASEIYRQVNPSVAFVLIENLSGYSSGSGFFIDSNGTLITNYHVIDDGLSGAIQLYDGTVATIDSVIGYDKNLDIAILSTSAKNTSPVKIADSIIQVGETVYAIGYPEAFKLGFSSSTFTSGMVSMHRSIEGYSYIQSTVNITHGNSGGALINKYGEVVGITTSGITYGNIDYMNLSIPIQRIDTVSRTANEPLVIVTRRKYPVYATFYSDGAKYTTQTLSYEGRASVPTAPVKAGYTLDGWYTDNSFTEKFDFNKKITSDVSIYAKWSVTTYTIDYNLNSGSWNGSAPSTTYTLNDCGYALPVPTREGYIFEGWKNLSGNFISNYPDVNHLRNLSLYASWVEGTEGLMFSTYYTNYVSVTGYNGNADNVVIPKTYRGIPVKEIKDSAFSYQTRLKSITLPDSVTSIGNDAFYGCSGLTSIFVDKRNTKYHSAGNCLIETATKTLILGCKTSVIPTDGSVTSIGNYAFYDCTGLTSITIPDSVTHIGDYAFSYCTGLTSVIIGNNVTSIGGGAFRDCTGLTSITIPDSVTSIGFSAFRGCSSLESITIPFVGAKAGVTSNDTYQFPFGYIFGTSSYTGSIATRQYYYGSSTSSTTSTTYYIPSSLKFVTVTGGNILYGAFYECSGLTSVTIGNSVTSIGSSSFFGCTGLKSVTIPESVTSIGSSAFRGCSSLESITIPFVGAKAGVTSNDTYQFPFGYIFGTSSYTGSIATRQYYYGSSTSSTTSTTYYIPSSLKFVTVTGGNILYGAFYNCKELTSVTIGNGVTSIGESAFSGCSSLESITIPFVGAKAGVTSNDTYQFPFGYIFGTNRYTGGVATKQYYYGSSTSATTSNTYYIPSSLKFVTVTGGNILYGAFYNCTGLTSVTIGNGVTSIGRSAFEGCTRLTSITIPDSVTSIGECAFSWCTKLTSVTIGNGVTSIGDYAFRGCSGLTSVTIGNGVTSIGDSAFQDCTGLTSINVAEGNTKYHSAGNCLIETASKTLILGCNTSVIPSDGSVTSIGDSAFESCTGLTSVTIPDSVTSIGRSAFYNCTGLTSVTIGSGVKSIGEDAFLNCTGLTSVTIPDSVTSIGNYAFRGCSGLTSVTIGNGVTSIGECAFYNCTGLTSVTIGNGVTSIGDSAFQDCTGLTSINVAEGNTKYHSAGNCLIETASKTLIFGCKTSVIPSDGSVTSIGSYAFKGCTGLTSITIPNSVTNIGDWVFVGCNSLTSITISENVISIGNNAFSGCKGLTSITIPDNVTSIGERALYNCTGLTSVTIGNGVTSIGDSAFSGCSGLTSITIPDSVTNIGRHTFAYCSGLTSVTIGNGVTSIGWAAFMGCNRLTSILVADGNTKYHSSGNCLIETTSKTLILGCNTSVIPSDGSVTSIGDSAFESCTGLTSVTIPDSVTSIGRSAFYNCTGLTSVTIPNSVTSIGYSAFSYCRGLTSVTIGNSVTSLGEYAFNGCTGLTNIKFNGTIAQWNAISKGGSWKYNVPSACKVICTDGTISISEA